MAIAPDEDTREIPFTFDPKGLGIPELLEQPYTLRLTVRDERGERQILAAEPLSTSVVVAGEATMELFINDVLFMSWNP